MHFNQLARVIPALLDSGKAIELISAPGRGKSTFVADTVERMSKRDGKQWGFSTLFLATQTPPDLIGFVFKGNIKDQHGGDIATSEPTLPAWMITQEGKPVWEHERGILFLDEFGQGQADVKAAAAELLLNGRIGRHQLPKGWSVIAASNRTSDRSGVTKSLDFVINRRVEIGITDDIESWEDWSFRNGVDPLFITFARQNPAVVFTEGVPEKQGPWCTPRSLVMLNDIFNKMKKGDELAPTDATAIEIASGMIGLAAAQALMAHVKLGQEMPPLEDIIKNPKKTKVPTKPDVMMLVAYSLASRVSVDNVDPIVDYMDRAPKEFAVTFARQAVKRDGAIILTDAFDRWTAANASLMTALADLR